MKKNPRLIIMIICLILVAQLIFVYSKASNERTKEKSELHEVVPEAASNGDAAL